MKRAILLAATIAAVLVFSSCNTKIEYPSNSSSQVSQVSDSISSQQSSVTDTSDTQVVSRAQEQSSSTVTSSSIISSSSFEASSEASSSKEPDVLTVSLTITGLDGDILYNSDKTEITDNINVFDLTEKICKQNSIAFESSMTGYISSMGGYEEKKPKSSNGWLYRVNGVVVSKSSAKYKLHGGEKVEWIFSTDYGKSLN